MVHGGNSFTFNLDQRNLQQHIATVTVSREHILAVYKQALKAQQAQAQTYGFSKGDTPLFYIEHNFKPNILEHIKELFFTHCVINYLCRSLFQHKIVIAGDPLLIDITVAPASDAHFIFSLTRVPFEVDERWKKLHLHAPERKNYKDLDRQVESFIKEEQERFQKNAKDTIDIGDWVCFEMSLVSEEGSQLLSGYKDELWIRINDEEADRELQELFVGKKIGDSFISKNGFFQVYVSNELDMHYNFNITIKDSVPYAYFSFDHFKRHFHIKSAREMHHKLIEVFSYRNDLSQRRETVEATFKLLLKQYFMILPQYLLERQRQLVLNAVYANPDYHVYKAQNDFKEKVRLLAEKQLKEAIIIDSIAYQENIQVTHEDLICYLNLVKRPRTKEFIYFGLPATKLKGQEVPLSTEILKQSCLREKTLNHVIYYLTKKHKA